MSGALLSGALSDALVGACRAHALQIAIRGDAAELRYRDLEAQARTVCTTLQAAGIEADEPVHVQVSNQPLDIAAILGIWLAGGVAVPVHRTTPREVTAGFARRTQARWTVDLASDRPAGQSLISLAAQPPPHRGLLRQAALVVFTSGSTGAPKGVVVAHGAFHSKIEQIDSMLRLSRGDRTLLVLNINFSFGLWVSLLTLLRGGTLLMRSRFEPDGFLQALVEHRITRVGMVPTMMRVLFSDAQRDAAIGRVNNAAHLRQIWIGGEALGPSLGRVIRDRFSATELVDIYGLTETATCDFFAFPADYAKHPGCIGRPSPQVQYRIAADGELQLRSPYLMQGYLDEPALTAAAYQDGWFRTGDLGRVVDGGDVDGGVVELMGRQKDVISRAGNKVTPAEIEQAICSHPDVAAAMAVGIDDALLGQRIHLLLVPRSGATLTLDDLKSHLAPRLERYKQPDTYYVADALPLGRTGKADRTQFKQQASSASIAPMLNGTCAEPPLNLQLQPDRTPDEL